MGVVWAEGWTPFIPPMPGCPSRMVISWPSRARWMAATIPMIGVLVLGTLYGLLAAVGQSVLGLVYRAGQVEVDVMGKVKGEKAAWGSVGRDRKRRTVDGILVLRLSAPLFWVNATKATVLVMDEVEFNFLTSRIVSKRSVVFSDGRSVNHDLSIRAYCLHELGRLLHSAGFRVVSVTGNINTTNRFYGQHSPYLIILSEKPE